MQAASECLGPGSPVARALPGFRPREEQRAMAAAVEEAFAEGHHLVVEAGTGVGKSFAYLVPAFRHVQGGGGPVVIATRTIALQEQLVQRDIPLLLDALDADVPVALAKGRGNYVCRRRLDMALGEGGTLFPDAARLQQLARIADWAAESEDGSLADLPFRPDPELWEAVRAESGNCLHRRCPHFKGCAYQRSRRALHEARVLVANHALVFADLALRENGASLLPDYECLVLDEAHELEESAASNFGAAVSATGVTRQLNRFMGVRRRQGLFGRVEVNRATMDLAEAVRAAADAFFESVARFRGERGERRVTAPDSFPDRLTRPLEKLVRRLREEEAEIGDPGLMLEWRSRTSRLEETLHAVRLVHGVLDPDCVYWIEAAGRGDRSRLRAAPSEIAPILKRTLFARVRSVVMTSATLQVARSFEHFRMRVGLEEPTELALGSPFDFARQCRLVLYPSLPDPRDPAWEDAVVERLRELVHETAGGAFLLFTSYRQLIRAHDALAQELRDAGLHVMRQGSELRTQDIVRAFAERGDCVLFGTDTFWQGIDVRGSHLRLVAMTRLPFAVPDHPVQQARVERIEAKGGDAFRDYSLPQAVLKLRQGFGRLIRSHEDEGTVAILDPRIRTKRYGRVFLESLPPCRIELR